MYRKILVGGVTAAAIVGAGGVALAVGGSDTSGAAPVATVSSDQSQLTDRHPLLSREGRILRRVVHGAVVVQGKDGLVTHNIIVGTVTDVSAASISVRAEDGTSETFVVNSDTKVRVLGDGQRGLSSIDKIAAGDRVGVAGTGTSTLTAKHVVKLPKS
jgi:hypothetical protein